MPIDVTCQKCTATLAVPDEFAGRHVRCGGCAEIMTVPAAGPPPLPGEPVPPPLPEPPLAVAKPVTAKPVAARPVARAVPISAPPRREELKTAEPDEAPQRPRSQTGTALLVIGGILGFLLICGIVFMIAVFRITDSVKRKNEIDAKVPTTQAPTDARINPPAPPVKPVPATRPAPATKPFVPKPTPPKTPPTGNTPPTRYGPIPANYQAPSPQGMPGLVMYVSFDNDTLRDDVTRTPIETTGLPLRRPGARSNLGIMLGMPNRNEDEVRYAVALNDWVNTFRFGFEKPFTICFWTDRNLLGLPAFALHQNGLELAPRIEFVNSNKIAEVSVYCDPNDSEKRFVRRFNQNTRLRPSDLAHLCLTRSDDGTLTFYVDGDAVTDVPPESLPAKQPGEWTFKTAGFGRCDARISQRYGLDEFCLFNRALSAEDVRKLATRVERK